ncbi:hypothetical protein SAY86_010269 [Trapa natans]|uniref:TIR domain-containing protein n=1 Tax=Trapa natans TaxID=22666 RepID=A0AAN7L109_TRANT|nr:hypothetical protein SAY86_010269 [Trapa natans]
MAPKRNWTASGLGGPYEVFLNFRGPDTRKVFTNVLYEALVDAEVNVFKDYDDIQRGEKFGCEILRAIDESVIFVAIFSRNYASSKWCLIELSKMFESMEERPSGSCNKKILPVFYDVGADDVKLRTQLYTDALLKHEKNQSPETVHRWKEALRKAGNIMGYEIKDTGHGEFIKLLVREICMKLKKKQKFVTEYLVQKDDEVEALMNLLDVKAPDVRFVGIHGMGGIGKTTLAKIIFNKLCDDYEHSVFLNDVRGSSKQYRGIEDLQKRLLGNLGSKMGDIMDADDGIMRIRKLLGQKRALIVLDDVDHRRQAQYLSGGAHWFGQGSRIIITTRNREVLRKEAIPFEVAVMNTDEALQLFSMHAFDKESPLDDYVSLSNEAIESTGRLPLALEVIASYLRDMPRKKWAEAVERLKKVPHEDVTEKLMISYEALDHGTQQMFLDIACFFIGYEKTFPMYMWEDYYGYAKTKLEVLIHMSLIKIVVVKIRHQQGVFKKKKLWMHDQLRDMGRKIVRPENNSDGVNRLWMHEDAFDKMQDNEDKETVEMLRLHHNCNSTERYTYTREEFSGLKRLRYLECHRANFIGDLRPLIPNLKWLSWNFCSGNFTGLSLRKLVILDLSYCYIKEDWRGWSQIEVGNKLKVLNLSHTQLTKTPNFSGILSLERLILANCKKLVEIDPSIGKLKCLKFLNVSECTSLEGFPEELSCLDCLEVISGSVFYEAFKVDLIAFSERKDLCELASDCLSDVKSFHMPESFGSLSSLLTLVLYSAYITKLPDSISMLPRLRRLSLCGCKRFERLPESLVDMKSLVELRLAYTSIIELPERIGQLVKLEILDLTGVSIFKLPDSVGDMQSLNMLDISLSSISHLPVTIGLLKKLPVLCAWCCVLLEDIPSTISGCTCLSILNVGSCERMEQLPDSVWDLRSLTTLNLSSTGITEIPDTIGNLEKLRDIRMNSTRILRLPTSMGMLKRLEELYLQNCELLTEIPSEIVGCTSLMVLDIDGTGIKQLPPNFRGQEDNDWISLGVEASFLHTFIRSKRVVKKFKSKADIENTEEDYSPTHG